MRLKWLFSWFFVLILIFDLGYTFRWSVMRWPSVNFRKIKGSSQNLRIHQEILFFLAPILSSCLITSSLIHEATTLMEKTLQVLRASFIGSNCLLDQKGLLKARNAGYGSWLMKERKFIGSKGVWGFQRPRININYSSTLFLLLSL